MAGLQVLAVMRETGQALAELAAGMPRFPQTMINVKVAKKFDPKTVPEVEDTVQRVALRLGADGRVVLRPRAPSRSSGSWSRHGMRPIPCVAPRKSPPWSVALRPEGRAAIIAPLF